ncbi:hypothetical protein LIA77_10980 [Sarocladium implicatum]|nr:hypothetical protein LIA77_10980 [Sarocladium implicatum]
MIMGWVQRPALAWLDGIMRRGQLQDPIPMGKSGPVPHTWNRRFPDRGLVSFVALFPLASA